MEISMLDWQNICNWSMFHSYVSLLEVSFWLQKEIAYPIFSKTSHTDGSHFDGSQMAPLLASPAVDFGPQLGMVLGHLALAMP